jgi:hypothetical protein
MHAHKHLIAWVLVKKKVESVKNICVETSPSSAKCQTNKPQAPGSYMYEVQQLCVTVVWKQMCVLS